MKFEIRPISQIPRFVSFVFFGGLNTVVTYAIYLFLSGKIHYQLAYFIAYATGILLAYVLNLRFVFKEKSSLKKVLVYPLVYAVQYLLGAGLMYFLIQVFSTSNFLAPLIATAVLVPVAYYMNRRILIG